MIISVRKLPFLFLLISFMVGGCKQKQADEANEADVNSSICKSCNAKFYTDRAVFAEFCPACKGVDLKPVIAFICPKDKHATLTIRGPEKFNCEKCGEVVTTMRLPNEIDLKGWGALKKSKNEVCR